MPIAKGTNIVSAFKMKTSPWSGPAESLGTGDRVLLTTESVAVQNNVLFDESFTGTAFRNAYDIGGQQVAGGVEMYNRYDGLELLIAMAMGHAEWNGGTGVSGRGLRTVGGAGFAPYAYYQKFELKNDLRGYYMTFAMDKQVSIHEYDSVKLAGMTLRGEAGGRVTLAFEMMGRKPAIPATVNTSSSGWTERLPRMYVLFQHCRVRMNEQSAGGLTNAHSQIYPSAFEIHLTNNFTTDTTSENDPYIDEPAQDGFTEVNGSISIPNYKNDATVTAFLAGTKMKLDVVAESNVQIPKPGGNKYYYKFRIFLPQIQIDDAQRQAGGPGRIAGDFSFQASRPENPPVGMNGTGSLVSGNDPDSGYSWYPVTTPLHIEVMNVNKSNPLS
jgi:hypothetical protein